MTAKRESEAFFGALSSADQTRILFMLVLIGESFSVFFTTHLIWTESKVPYSVIRAQSPLRWNYALVSDYLKDFSSFCYRRLNVFYIGLGDEFSSYYAKLKLVFGKEKNKEDRLC